MRAPAPGVIFLSIHYLRTFAQPAELNPPAAEQALPPSPTRCEGVGFYFLENTAALLPDEVVRGMLDASRRVHAAPAALKESLSGPPGALKRPLHFPQ